MNSNLTRKRGYLFFSLIVLIILTTMFSIFFFYNARKQVSTYYKYKIQKVSQATTSSCLLSTDLSLNEYLKKKVPNLKLLDPGNLDEDVLFSCDRTLVEFVNPKYYDLLKQYGGSLFLVGDFFKDLNKTISFLNSSGIIAYSNTITLSPEIISINPYDIVEQHNVIIKDEREGVKIISTDDNSYVTFYINSYTADYMYIEIDLITIQSESGSFPVHLMYYSSTVDQFSLLSAYSYGQEFTYKKSLKEGHPSFNRIRIYLPSKGTVIIIKGIRLYKGNFIRYKVNFGFNRFLPNNLKVEKTVTLLKIESPPSILRIINGYNTYPLLVASGNIYYFNDVEESLTSLPEIKSMFVEFLRGN